MALINKAMLIPEVVSRYPSTRGIFDKYGLKGCGGPEGPQETLAFFARVHAVDEGQLLTELNEAAEEEVKAPAPSQLVYEETLADILYRRFFKAGITTALTAGCLMGAVILIFIAFNRSFTSFSLLPLIHAHGNAQVFGWVGLFVMGFAYQAFPRFKYTTLWGPRLANLSFYLMVLGIGLRMAITPLSSSGGYVGLGVLSGLLELAAVVIFLTVIIKTLSLSERRDFYDKYIYASLLWFLIAAILNPFMFYLVASAGDTDTLIFRIASFFGPYRDIQFLGFVSIMILGVSQRFLPAALDMREPNRSISTGIFWLLNAAVLADAGFYLLLRRYGSPVSELGLQAAYLAFFIVSVIMAVQLGIFSGSGERDRSLKFVRAAYSWLIVAALMLALFPLYNLLTGQDFSHAFLGAHRHALTVGFISMMILGVSGKVVPMLSGADPRGLSSLFVPFILLNLGNGVRVSSQILTDHLGGWTYTLMGTSGFVEVAALALWGYELWGTMNRRGVSYVEVPQGRPERIEPDMKVADVLELFPETFEVFLRYGFTDLRNPVKRRTLAKMVSIRRACKIHSVDVADFLDALNRSV